MPDMAIDTDPLETRDSLAGRAAMWLATGLGVGLVAPAPGTIGGLWGLALVDPIVRIAPLEAQIAVIGLLIILAANICTSAVREMGVANDPGAIVLDEIVALPIVFVGFSAVSWPLLAAGFLLFRLFDISKIGLADSAEKLPGGWGVVADDCVAALQACLALHGVAWLDRTAGYDWLATSA
jgi:phosphatidylglycerophosphatase A